MAKEYEKPGDSFSDSPEQPDPKSEFLARLRQEVEDNHIPADALDDWLDVKFRNEALVDNNIVWGRAIRSFTEHLPTVALANGLEQQQWRTAQFDGVRFMIKIMSFEEPIDTFNAADHETYKKLQGYFSLGDLFEESDLRNRLRACFYGGLTQLNYEYFVHQDDLGRLPDLPDLEDALTFEDSEVYIPTSGYSIGLRPFNPETPLCDYKPGIHPSEFIADVHANTLYNEAVWDAIEHTQPLARPMPYQMVTIA